MNVCGGVFCKTLAVRCKTIHFESGIPIKNEPRRAVLRGCLGGGGVNRREVKKNKPIGGGKLVCVGWGALVDDNGKQFFHTIVCYMEHTITLEISITDAYLTSFNIDKRNGRYPNENFTKRLFI